MCIRDRHGALYAFSFEADSYIQSIALNLWPTWLVVKWPGFVMKHVLQGFSVEFPRMVQISLWTARKTYTILQAKDYYCLALTEYRQQFRLIEFDKDQSGDVKSDSSPAILLWQNNQNELYVVSQSVAAAVPADVHKLYPSFWNLHQDIWISGTRVKVRICIYSQVWSLPFPSLEWRNRYDFVHVTFLVCFY